MKAHDEHSNEHPRDHASRRRAIRLTAPTALKVTLSDPRIEAEVVDVGQGGLGLTANRPLSQQRTYTVTLRLGKKAFICDAHAVHCRQREDNRWVVGMAFVRDERMAQIELLIDLLTNEQIQFS